VDWLPARWIGAACPCGRVLRATGASPAARRLIAGLHVLQLQASLMSAELARAIARQLDATEFAGALAQLARGARLALPLAAGLDEGQPR